MMYYFSTKSQPKPNWILMILWSLLVVALGLFILFDTHEFAQILSLAFGVFLLFTGILNLYFWFRSAKQTSVEKLLFWQGLFRLVIGILVVSLPMVLATITWVTMLYLIAAQFLVSAIVDFSMAWRVQRTGFPLGVNPTQHLSNGLLSFLGALMLFIAPRFIGLVILQIIGFSLVLIGLASLALFGRFWWIQKKRFA